MRGTESWQQDLARHMQHPRDAFSARRRTCRHCPQTGFALAGDGEQVAEDPPGRPCSSAAGHEWISPEKPR